MQVSVQLYMEHGTRSIARQSREACRCKSPLVPKRIDRAVAHQSPHDRYRCASMFGVGLIEPGQLEHQGEQLLVVFLGVQ